MKEVLAYYGYVDESVRVPGAIKLFMKLMLDDRENVVNIKKSGQFKWKQKLCHFKSVYHRRQKEFERPLLDHFELRPGGGVNLGRVGGQEALHPRHVGGEV